MWVHARARAEPTETNSSDDSPVPRISVDYLFLGDRHPRIKKPTAKMTTKQLRKKLKIAELPTSGSRLELERRFQEFRQKTLAEAGLSSSDEDDDEESPNASAYPAIVMIDEETGNRYMRMVPCKGLGDEGEAKWVVKDMHEELKAWGRPGGQGNALLVNTDGEKQLSPYEKLSPRCTVGL